LAFLSISPVVQFSKRTLLADLPDGRAAESPVKLRAQKYFCFPETETGVWFACPAFLAEGRIAIVTNVERDAVDAKMLTDERHRRGRRSRVVLTRQGRCQVRAR
jgi:hypothetical protein